jgi:hypothetical protein
MYTKEGSFVSFRFYFVSHFTGTQKYIIKSKMFTPWSYGLPYFSDVHLASKLIMKLLIYLYNNIAGTL